MNQHNEFSFSTETKDTFIKQRSGSKAISYDSNGVIDSNNSGTAILLQNGHIVAWGDTDHGGELPSEIAELNDIVSLSATQYAFAALRADRSVVTWGDAGYGGKTCLSYTNILTRPLVIELLPHRLIPIKNTT
ncbi:hypothetical protein [Photorhabdus laumondii]|uniref:Uncharacterized protein n=1 Tax=Photorhabdus laumondii subsp. clarkei TaxID=2029685 RepID=A0A329VFB0_9GAMM|nr:hypothetical protein [Photorhabdus laumondii]RAW87498.1 hypothetical protein CKY01_17080 [Photorhabdus laumondii subsp. clarkei]